MPESSYPSSAAAFYHGAKEASLGSFTKVCKDLKRIWSADTCPAHAIGAVAVTSLLALSCPAYFLLRGVAAHTADSLEPMAAAPTAQPNVPEACPA